MRSRSPKPADHVDLRLLFDDRADIQKTSAGLYATLQQHILILPNGTELWGELQRRFTQYCGDVRRLKTSQNRDEYFRSRKARLDTKLNADAPQAAAFWPMYILLRTAMGGNDASTQEKTEGKQLNPPPQWWKVFSALSQLDGVKNLKLRPSTMADQQVLSLYDQWVHVMTAVMPRLHAELFEMPTLWFKMADCKVMKDDWPPTLLCYEWARAAFEGSLLGGRAVRVMSNVMLQQWP